MPLTPVNGLQLHTEVIGDGPPVALIHGLLIGNLAFWYFTAALALARSHRLLMYDLRGHGRSERTASGFDLATMTGDLAQLLDGFDAGPVALVGHSYGALIALRYALENPERVSRLVLVDAPLPPARFNEIVSFLQLDPAGMIDALPEPLQQSFFSGDRRAKRLLAAVEYLAAQTSLIRDVLAEPDVPDESLARIACDVLCIYGETSGCRPVGERLARVIPRARSIVLPGGHFFPLESPGLLADRLTEFLRA
jgi:pimeloyl-ACP methyl ester carboxylesterase